MGALAIVFFTILDAGISRESPIRLIIERDCATFDIGSIQFSAGYWIAIIATAFEIAKIGAGRKAAPNGAADGAFELVGIETCNLGRN